MFSPTGYLESFKPFNQGTGWHSAEGVPQWVVFELDVPWAVCRISYLSRLNADYGNGVADCPTNYRFQGSNDGVIYETLYSETNGERCIPGRFC